MYSLVRDTIKSAPQPLKCHGDKGRLSPSRRRNAYVLSRAGVAASHGVARRPFLRARCAAPFSRGKASFPARLIPGEIAPSLRPVLYIYIYIDYRLSRLTFKWEKERNEDEARISTFEMLERQSGSSIKSECTKSTVIEDRPPFIAIHVIVPLVPRSSDIGRKIKKTLNFVKHRVQIFVISKYQFNNISH